MSAPSLPLLVQLLSDPVPLPDWALVERISLNGAAQHFGFPCRIGATLARAAGRRCILGRVRGRSDQLSILGALFRARPAELWWLASGNGLSRIELHGNAVVVMDGPMSISAVLEGV